MKKLLLMTIFLTLGTWSQAQIQNIQIGVVHHHLDSNTTESLNYQADYMFSKDDNFYIGGSVRSNHDFKDFFAGPTALVRMNIIKSDMIIPFLLISAGINTDFSDKPVQYYDEVGLMLKFIISTDFFINFNGSFQHYKAKGQMAAAISIGRRIK